LWWRFRIYICFTYDLETYSVGQDKWLEVSSISNFETFQSNRLKLRYRNQNREINLAHTLNGSALGTSKNYGILIGNKSR
jgi:seryl-tRNA synthetase